jgi:hypothetical protein
LEMSDISGCLVGVEGVAWAMSWPGVHVSVKAASARSFRV